MAAGFSSRTQHPYETQPYTHRYVQTVFFYHSNKDERLSAINFVAILFAIWLVNRTEKPLTRINHHEHFIGTIKFKTIRKDQPRNARHLNREYKIIHRLHQIENVRRLFRINSRKKTTVFLCRWTFGFTKFCQKSDSGKLTEMQNKSKEK